MKLTDRLRRLVPEISRFLTVGAFAYVVDVGVFNLVRLGSEAYLPDSKPLTAKVISTIAATLVAFSGNKNWTYSNRSGRKAREELFLFLAMNAIALVIGVTCLYTSHYLLGFTSALADNISANIVGVGLGTLFRFYSYRRWVFVHSPAGK